MAHLIDCRKRLGRSLWISLLSAVALAAYVGPAWAEPPIRIYLIGNSLTWDTVPGTLDGTVHWHVDCGKSLPYIFNHPNKPCVKSSKLWPQALKENRYDFLVVQPHYGSTLHEDVETIVKWAEMQPDAAIVIHTGWARQESRAEEYANDTATGKLVHSPAYFRKLVGALRKRFPERSIRQTYAIDLLDQIAADIRRGEAPFASLAELHRDKIHMTLDSGRYLMHNAMRAALGQPASARGFEGLDPKVRKYLDHVLRSVRTARLSSEQVEGLDRDFAYDRPDKTIAATTQEGANNYDADVVAVGDRLWLSWLEYIPGKGDQIRVARHSNRNATRSFTVGSIGVYSRPTLTVDSQQRMWLSFEVEIDGQWDVFVWQLENGQPVGDKIRVSSGNGADVRHRVAADNDGGLWFVWQSDQNGQFEIVSRHFHAPQLSPLEVVSRNPRGDWHPDLAVDGNRLVVVWDRFDGSSYDVMMRLYDKGQWQPPVLLAGGPAFQGRAQVVTDKQHHCWIAWEEGGGNWGRPYRGISTLALRDHRGPLHRHRSLALAVIRPDGAIAKVQPPPMPARDHAIRRHTPHPGIRRTGAYYERPRLAVDNGGRVWIAYRHFYCPWIGITHHSHVEAGWGVYARYLDEAGWSQLYRFSIGQGDGMQSLELAPHGNGIAAVWTTGRTHRSKNGRPRGIATAGVTAPDPGKTAIPSAAAATQEWPRQTAKPPTADATSPLRRREYSLFFGDLHRHTDLSLCRVPTDGTMDDAYRYAIDVADLDFLGITDHSRDLDQGDALSQLWWRCRKNVTRYELQGEFVPFFAYERSHANTADHNVISLRPDMLRPHTYPVSEFWKELDDRTITIPHQPVRRDTWKYQNDRLRPLAEIFQGCRNHSIEDDIHRGLAKGYHLGFIASSDHQSTSASYAGVWAESRNRESIFRALQSRRTFGSTSKMKLAVTAGEHWMGERIVAEEFPTVSLEADAATPIRRVELLIDGRVTETLSPNKRRFTLRRSLRLAGNHYVYFHLVEANGNEAWSSPIWLESP